jgi:hypothetical protein
VRTITNSCTLGIAGNVNELLRRPKVDFIVRLDSDDLLERKFVEQMVEAFKRWPEAGIFHCNSFEIGADGEIRGLRTNFRVAGYESAQNAFSGCPYRCGVVANICGLRRTMLEALDYTSGRPDYLSDYDLWCRAAAAGYGNVFSDARLASYRVWVDAQGMRLRRKELELRGLIQMFNEVIEFEWKKRGLPTRVINRARTRHALQHVPYLAEVNLSTAEQVAVSRLLADLSNGNQLIIMLAALGRSPLRPLLLAMRDTMRWIAARKRTFVLDQRDQPFDSRPHV